MLKHKKRKTISREEILADADGAKPQIDHTEEARRIARCTNAGMFLVTGYSYVLACKLASGSLFLIAIAVLHSVVTPIEVYTVFNVFLLATRNIYLHYEVS